MKKIFILIITLFVAFVFLIKPTSANSERAGITITDGSNLNIRVNASLSASVIAKIPDNTYVDIIGEKGSFYYINYKNVKGYSSKEYIKEKNLRLATTLDNLNIRSSASTSAKILDVAPKGSTLKIISSDTYWSKVIYNGYTGYAYNNYLKSQATNVIKLNTYDFKQYDSRWASVKITPTKTIKQIGCLTTAMAICESYRLGTTLTPDQMVKRLSYTSSGDMYWPSNYKTSTLSSYLSTIYDNLKKGIPTIVGVKNSNGSHFVVVNGNTNGKLTPSSFTINDPGYATNKTLADLFKSYPTFYKIAYYSK